MVNVWWSACGPCRAEAGDLAAAHDRAGRGASFVGINIRDTSPAVGAGSSRRSGACPTPPSTTPTARRRSPSPATCARAPSPAPSSSTPRAGWPPSCPGRSRPTQTLVDLVDGAADRWVSGSSTRPRRAPWCWRIPVALVAGLVSFFSPCVRPAAAGLPLLRHRTVRRGPAGRRGDPAPTAADAHRVVAVRARLHRRVRADRVWPPAPWAAGSTATARTLNIVLGVVSILLGLVFLGWCPFAQREWRVHTVPGRRAGRGAASSGSCSDSAGRPASARRSA